MKHKHRARPPPTTRNIPELGISLENSVRQFSMTFLNLIGSDPQWLVALVHFFQRQVSHHRIEIDRNSVATKGTLCSRSFLSWKGI